MHTTVDTQRSESVTETTAETETAGNERSSGEITVCPECGGDVREDTEHGENVCEECGLVLTTDELDRGPEWRAFDSNERAQKSRVGAPMTTMRHDKGLSTNIDWQDKDAHGNTIGSRQRQRMRRLRTWNDRVQAGDAQDRNLKQALGEIDRMASALAIPETVRETASVIYRRALSDGLLRGRSIEGIATAALYAAGRLAGNPRTIDELATVTRIEKLRFERAYRYLVRELDLEIAPADPESYVPRFASELALNDRTERRARELLNAGKGAGIYSGKSPVGLAAASLYAASQLTREDTTQKEIADVAGVSTVTVRKRYRELLKADSEQPS